MIADGTIVDVRDRPHYNAEYDHALYPELAWNEATGKWVVMWEESYLDVEANGTGERVLDRWATTIDEEGNVGQVSRIGVCRFGDAPTSHDGDDQPGAPGGDEDPISPRARGYCYPINMANDYYSLDGIDMFQQDRNPTHSSLVNGYDDGWRPYRSGNQWLQSDGADLLDNFYDDDQKLFLGPPVRQSIAVIGHPYFRPQTEFEDASYLQVNYVWEPPTNCKTVFYLVVDNPEAFHTEGVYDNQQYYRVEADSWDFQCLNRAPWGSASSLVSFVSVWAQSLPPDPSSPNPNEDWQPGFGVYGWLP